MSSELNTPRNPSEAATGKRGRLATRQAVRRAIAADPEVSNAEIARKLNTSRNTVIDERLRLQQDASATPDAESQQDQSADRPRASAPPAYNKKADAIALPVEQVPAADVADALPGLLLDRLRELRERHEAANAERHRLARPAEDDRGAIEAKREELNRLRKTRAKLELRGKRDELRKWIEANGERVAELHRQLSVSAELAEANAIARRDVLRDRLAELDAEQTEIEVELAGTLDDYAAWLTQSLRVQRDALNAAATRVSATIVALGRLGRQSDFGDARAPRVMVRSAQKFRGEGFGAFVDEARAREIVAAFSRQVGPQFLRA
ncbi:hypothetical protein [Paraburkholderia silvatlantica]|uniref:Plasmid replication DNA-binding protein KfrA n=1 Tax=Paraburkholderia silvatlantica TaxID=321895 RepID=A0ABR6FRU0_9BURK|nr:hypothetical protein [Paraburkholderia silvatlantica]MBB2930145.1 hypothetical protein [Paraburkholderia silvatlantica]PVY22486.1 hypothetical protein C7411_13186 [Paraburkholderia silvatlantica]PXW28955.1 hypothetical protein C7413_13186 [Paraburkholderia silvatlantica]